MFSAPPTAVGEHPTVHTIPLSRPEPPPPPPPPVTVQPSDTALQDLASTPKPADKLKASKARPKAELSPPTGEGPEVVPDAPPEVEKEPEKPRVSSTVCETVDGRRRVFRATRNGRLVKVSISSPFFLNNVFTFFNQSIQRLLHQYYLYCVLKTRKIVCFWYDKNLSWDHFTCSCCALLIAYGHSSVF